MKILFEHQLVAEFGFFESKFSSGIAGFFKRLRWINFQHGDAKTSNFFISGKNIIALDLDAAGYENFFSRFNGLSRDKKRLLKSIANYPKLHKKLFKRM